MKRSLQSRRVRCRARHGEKKAVIINSIYEHKQRSENGQRYLRVQESETLTFFGLQSSIRVICALMDMWPRHSKQNTAQGR